MDEPQGQALYLDRRVKVVYFAPEILQTFVTQGNKIPVYASECIRGLPEGAVFIVGAYDGNRRAFAAVFYHPSWEMVEDGQMTPELRVEINQRVR